MRRFKQGIARPHAVAPKHGLKMCLDYICVVLYSINVILTILLQCIWLYAMPSERLHRTVWSLDRRHAVSPMHGFKICLVHICINALYGVNVILIAMYLEPCHAL